MDLSLSDRSLPELLAGAYIVVVLVALIVAASTSGAAFGAFTFSWEGTSDLRGAADASDADLQIVTDTAQYGDQPANNTVAFVLSPDQPYTGEEREQLRTFVENGGTLVVADAFGQHSNALLADVGASARFNGDPLRDEQEYYRSPALPVATNVSDHPYVAQSESITINRGTVVEPGQATVLAASSEYGYLDTNRNEELDETETLGSYPVVTAEEVGDGEVVAVSDPSAFINAMLERPGNEAFAESLFALHDRILFDTSHSTDIPPTAMALLTLRGSALLQLALGGGLVLSIMTLGQQTLGGRWAGRDDERVGLSESELRQLLEERHPDWDDDRRERVITTIMSRKKRSEND